MNYSQKGVNYPMYYNWYKVAKIQQEAGLKEMIPRSLLAAVLAVISGSSIGYAAQNYNVEQSEIENALSNPKIMSALQDQENDGQNQDKMSKEQRIQENIIARTIYAEGRGESHKGLMAIATVIFNRGKGTPEGMVAAIKKPFQFSCWNSADASDWVNMKQGSGQAWDQAMNIANTMMNGSFNPLDNWNHYYNPWEANPYWAYTDKSKTQLRPFVTIGNHRFMTL
jgi:spore germination cell wall hydrolase CwlJ-like protein